jgi:hypothetical protein
MFCAMTKVGLLLIGALCAAVLPAPTSKAATKPKTKPAPAAPAAPVADPGPAHVLGSAGSWTAYLAQNKAGKVCYMVGQPEKAQPAAMNRKPATAMVTHRTEDDVSNVVSFDEGYPLNEEADVNLEVGADKFTLFAKDDSAWARTAELDKTIVAALAKEKQAALKATPKKGRATTDIYSLAGFSKALSLIDKACDIKR